VFEQIKLIAPLTDPTSFGDRTADAPSPSTTIGGGSVSLKGSQPMTPSRIGSLPVPSSPCPPLRSKGTPTGAPHPAPTAYAAKFSGRYVHRNVNGGIGHNLPQEAPQAFASAIVDADAL
jgi:hypothetical protein